MKQHALLSFASLLLILTLSACKDEHAVYSAPPPETHDLPVTKVVVQEIPRLYTVPGSVISDERIQISSRITGYIQKISVHEGDPVKQGMVLVEIDPTEIEAAIRQAEAAVKSATTSLKDAERDVVRLRELKRKRVVSQENYRKATVARDVIVSKLAEAKAALDSTLAQRRYAIIKSPFDGITVARQKERGDLASPGTPILTIESKKRFLFETYVAESQVRHIKVGGKITVVVDAMGEQEIAGSVLRIIPSVDPVTRRYQVEIALPDGLKAYPGMFGRAHFIVGSDRVPVAARSALVERGGLTGVFIVDKENRLRFRWLRTGREWPGENSMHFVEIKAGLTGGETVLAHDDRRVRDGDWIMPIKKVAADD